NAVILLRNEKPSATNALGFTALGHPTTGAQGFEPRSTAPKAGVLPLHYAPTTKIILSQQRAHTKAQWRSRPISEIAAAASAYPLVSADRANPDTAVPIPDNSHHQSRAAIPF